MSTKLFVGNLSFQTSELELQDLFAPYGPVTEVNLMTDRVTGRPRGFAFVTMGTPEAAQAAIGALAGKNVNGRDLTVDLARPREERPASRGNFDRPERRGGGGGGNRREDRGDRRARY